MLEDVADVPIAIPDLWGLRHQRLLTQAGTLTHASPLALAILLAIFVVGAIRAKLPLADRPAWGPVAFGLAAALPMLLAIAAALLVAPGSTDY